MKKFELTGEFVTNFWGKKLFRIRALVEFGNVKKGDLGGYVENEQNLSQEGNAWVCGDARVYGDARVNDNAMVYGDAEVYGDAMVCGDARVYGDARVNDNAMVCGDARVCGDAWVCGDAMVCGDARVYGDADYAMVKGFGRCNRNTTFFRCNDGKIRVVCGCFFGDMEEFRSIVKRTHGGGKLEKEYLAIADLMELHFAKEESNESGS